MTAETMTEKAAADVQNEIHQEPVAETGGDTQSALAPATPEAKEATPEQPEPAPPSVVSEVKSALHPSNFPAEGGEETSTPSETPSESLKTGPESLEPTPPSPIPEEILERFTEMEREITNLREEKKEHQETQRQQMVEARRHFLMNTYKMKSEAYLTVADAALPNVDPRTEAGEEQFRQWAISHPELFESLPKMPIIKEEEHETGLFRARNRKWSDVFKGRD